MTIRPLTTTLSVLVAVALMTLSATVPSAQSPEPAHPVSMAEASQALLQAGATTQIHGQAILDEARSTGTKTSLGMASTGYATAKRSWSAPSGSR